ncbi:MAG: OmpA/MotB family protein [Cellulosilyticaceae bacterium]
MKKKGKVKKENSERWLLTYSDLITLLMIFFVVMYAMSNVDQQKYSQLANSLGGVFSNTPYVIGEGTGNGLVPQENNEPGQEPINTQTTEEKVQQQIEQYLKDNQLQDKVKMTVQPRGLVLSLQENAFFESGKADILGKYEKNILEITDILKQLDNDLIVEGHTDNQAIHNSLFESNWELAAMRAINVIDLMVAEGGIAPEKMSATSYGEYRPVASNDTEEGRAKNRRIDIVVLNSAFYKK